MALEDKTKQDKGSEFCQVNALVIAKTLMLGKCEGRSRRGQQRMRWLNGITNKMDMGLGGLWKLVMDRQGGLVWCGLWGRKESDMAEQLNKDNNQGMSPAFRR